VADPETYTLSPTDLRLEPLANACAETRTAVVVGAPTRDPESGRLYISALVLGRDGRFAAQYDKRGPWTTDPPGRGAAQRRRRAGRVVARSRRQIGYRVERPVATPIRPERAGVASTTGCRSPDPGPDETGFVGEHHGLDPVS
jgi:hypothetical protein